MKLFQLVPQTANQKTFIQGKILEKIQGIDPSLKEFECVGFTASFSGYALTPSFAN